MVNARNKGAAGEREFCQWLKANLKLEASRNLDQPREGGIDIIVSPFGFEVKRCQTLSFVDWWIQAKTACEKIWDMERVHLMPVVAFRQNQMPWEFLISANNIGCEKGFIRISEKVFVEWSDRFIKV